MLMISEKVMLEEYKNKILMFFTGSFLLVRIQYTLH